MNERNRTLRQLERTFSRLSSGTWDGVDRAKIDNNATGIIFTRGLLERVV